MSKDSKIKKHDTIEAESTVFEHIKNNVFISNLMDNKIDLRVFYKSLWQHVLLVKVIELLYPSSTSFLDSIANFTVSNKKRYNLELARQYIDSYGDCFFNENIVTEITDKMQDVLSGEIKIGPAKVNGSTTNELTEKIQRATAKYVSNELLRKQKELIKLIKEESISDKQIRIIISIDDLDKSWLSSSAIRYDFINALLDAFKELIDIKSVKILISIRTDIIMGIYQNNLRQEEKDRSLIIPISWNQNEIRSILDYRIDYLIQNQYSGKEKVLFSDIFNFSVNGQPVDEYIINRTMLRPRDAIDFVNYCLAESDGSTALSEDLIIAAEEKFYHSRKQAICKEWVSLYPHIADYIDSIALLTSCCFKIDELGDEREITLNHIISKSNSSDDDRHDSIALDFKLLLNVWFVIGIIGIKKSNTLTIYSSFDKPKLDITDYNKQFQIHPLFYRYN